MSDSGSWPPSTVPLTTHFNDAAAGSTQDVSQTQQDQGQPYNPATLELQPTLHPEDTELVNDVHTGIENDKAFNHSNDFGPKL